MSEPLTGPSPEAPTGPSSGAGVSSLAADAGEQVERRPGLVARVVLGVIRGYQLAISPRLGPCCRFAPSCSEYAIIAIGRFGVVRGSWLALRRLSRCHPFHRGGWDPVPERRVAGGSDGCGCGGTVVDAPGRGGCEGPGCVTSATDAPPASAPGRPLSLGRTAAGPTAGVPVESTTRQLAPVSR